ncbi:hybrid signal transduction histidine kinase M [Tanacetum coccineum]
MKAELRPLKCGDLSINAYFRKIESISTILTSLGSPISNDDVVTFAIEGLNDKYEDVSDIIVHRDPFPDLKTVRSMLTTEEMRLKSKSQALHIDFSSSSPMILLAESCNNHRRSTVGQVKSLKPCFNFAKGPCRFGNNMLADLRGNANKVSFQTSFALTKYARKLATVDLSWCTKLTEGEVGFIMDNSSSLKLLKIYGCTKVSFQTAFALTKYARKLATVDLSWCTKLTLGELRFIIDNSSSLKLLKIYGRTKCATTAIYDDQCSVVQLLTYQMLSLTIGNLVIFSDALAKILSLPNQVIIFVRPLQETCSMMPLKSFQSTKIQPKYSEVWI